MWFLVCLTEKGGVCRKDKFLLAIALQAFSHKFMHIWRAESFQHSIDRLLEVQSHERCRQTYVVLKLFLTVVMSRVLSDQIGPICHLAHFFCTIFTSHKLHCAQLLFFLLFINNTRLHEVVLLKWLEWKLPHPVHLIFYPKVIGLLADQPAT